MADGVPIVLAHECDPQRHGCEFSTFIRVTRDEAPDLLTLGLFKPIAVPFLAGPHRRVSLALLAQNAGAKVDRPSMLRAAIRSASNWLPSSRPAQGPPVEARHHGQPWLPRRRRASELLAGGRESSLSSVHTEVTAAAWPSEREPTRTLGSSNLYHRIWGSRMRCCRAHWTWHQAAALVRRSRGDCHRYTESATPTVAFKD